MNRIVLLQTVFVLLCFSIHNITSLTINNPILNEEDEEHYGIIIDTGSSGSRIHLYHWTSTDDIEEIGPACKIDTPLTDFENNPDESHVEIVKCLEKDPFTQLKGKEGKTVLHLGATAGMRLLGIRHQSSLDNILQALRKHLSELPYKIGKINVISGQEEAFTAWITVNHLNGYFKHPSTQGSIGALDLGGASTQISFFNEEKNNVGNEIVNVFGQTYPVYSLSLLCYGMNQIKYRVLALILKDNNYTADVANPCGQTGDLMKVPSGEIFQEPCVIGKHAREVLKMDIIQPENVPSEFTFRGKVDFPKCLKYINEVFDNNYIYNLRSTIPPPKGKFFAMSSFYYTNTELNLLPSSTLPQFRRRVLDRCYKKVTKPTDSNYKTHGKWTCLQGIYVMRLLKIFGFDDSQWNDIEFVDQVNGQEVNWSMGYMIANMKNM